MMENPGGSTEVTSPPTDQNGQGEQEESASGSGVDGEEKRLTCGYCKRTFFRVQSFKAHLRTHTGERRFSCSVCSESFRTPLDVKRHMASHQEEKNVHECSFCDKFFLTRAGLSIHRKSCHSGKSDLPCPMCNRTFTSSSGLRRHLVSHTGEKQFPCHMCHMAFPDKKSLSKHVGQAHGGRMPHNCPLCSNTFMRKDALKGHLRSYHPDYKADENTATLQHDPEHETTVVPVKSSLRGSAKSEKAHTTGPVKSEADTFIIPDALTENMASSTNDPLKPDQGNPEEGEEDCILPDI